MTLAPRYAETHLVGVSAEIQEMETRFAVAVRQRELLESYIRERLKPGHHFYKVRDGSKNSLTKEGAELVCLPHGYQPMYFKEGGPDAPPEDNSPFQLTIRCRLMRGNLFAGEGMGSASSWLTDRDGQRKPRFRDPGLCHNATLKMAEKSAYIAATLNATAASEFFTQDMEDAEGEIVAEQHPPAPKDNRYHCSEHNATWTKHTGKDGSSWYSHKQGSGWCSMKDAKLTSPTEHDQEGPKSAPSRHADAEEAPSKDGPSGAAAEFEKLVLGLPAANSEPDVWNIGLKLGFRNKAEVQSVVGTDIHDYAQAVLKLVEESPLRPQETSGLS